MYHVKSKRMMNSLILQITMINQRKRRLVPSFPIYILRWKVTLLSQPNIFLKGRKKRFDIFLFFFVLDILCYVQCSGFI